MEKTKRDHVWKAGRIRFVVIWTVVSVLGSLLTALIATFFLFRIEGPDRYATMTLMLSTLSMLISAVITVQVVERLLKHAMRGWMLYTITGLALSWGVSLFSRSTLFERWWLELLLVRNVSPVLLIMLVETLSIFPLALMQGLWLRRHVKQAWLWPAVLIGTAAAKGGLTRIIVQSDSLYSFYAPFQWGWGLITLLLTGLTMYHLITHPKEREKAKHQAALTERRFTSQDIEAVQRLEGNLPEDADAFSVFDTPTSQKTES